MSRLAALALALLGLSATAAADPPAQIHDPLVALRAKVDAVARQVLDTHARYDVAGMLAAVRRLEARQTGGQPGSEDRYVAAQGYLQLVVIRRFYSRNAAHLMPAALLQLSEGVLAGKGLVHADAYRATHPEHADIHRVRGELISFQIRGMTSGMALGPKARRALDRSLALAPGNLWAHYAHARMLYHNPAFVGGDPDGALRTFRHLFARQPRLQLALYIARYYADRQMVDQARFWIAKALVLAPGNPEALRRRQMLARSGGGR